MRLVAAREANKLSRPVAAESWGDKNLAVGHDDGTISVYKQNALQLLWLNPGSQITFVTALDVSLLAGFDDGSIKLLNMENGLVTAEATLPFSISGAHVLEHYIACWFHESTKIWFVQRSNLDLWQCIEVDSFPLNIVTAAKGPSLVCTSDVYLLHAQDDQHYELQNILHLESPLVGAASVGQRWLLLRPHRWSLFSLCEGTPPTLDEEFKVDPPDETLFCNVTHTSIGAILQCNTGTGVLVKEGNIQVLDPPREEKGILTANAQLLWPDLSISEAIVQHGEIVWQECTLPVSRSGTKFLVDCTDPSIIAIKGKMIGTQDGRINGTLVLPGPILEIDAHYAHSPVGSIALPLHEVNSVIPPKKNRLLRDRRVTVQASSYDCEKAPWLGIRANDWLTLHPVSTAATPVSTSLLLVLEGHRTVEQVVSDVATSLTSIAQVEDVAVIAADYDNDKLCATAASILDKVWTSKRITDLMQSAGPRSLQVLSAVSPYIDIPKNTLQSLIVRMVDGPRADREAVLWVYEHKMEVVHDLKIPFSALKDLSEKTLTRFSEKMAVKDSAKLLSDAAATTEASDTSDTPYAADDMTEYLSEENVMKVLLSALSSPGPPVFPPSDEALASLVTLVVPAVHKRVFGAKKILAKLLSQSQLQYHQGRQRLLVPTPTIAEQAALVFEFNDSSNEPLVLQRPQEAKKLKPSERVPILPAGSPQMFFSADGKSVYAPNARGKLVWHFGGALRNLFKSKHPIAPVQEE